MPLAYMASPYSKLNHQRAFEEAAELCGRLLACGVHAYSPIAMCHPLAVYAKLDPMDLALWAPHCRIMMERCDCLIVAQLDGWQESAGIKGEIEFFQEADKPIFDLFPASLTMQKRGSGFHLLASQMELAI